MDMGIFKTTTNAPRKRVIVAVDDGYARIKVCAPVDGNLAGRQGGPPTIKEFGTVIARGSPATIGSDGAIKSSWIADGEQFSVDEHIAGDNVATDDFHWSLMNRVLVNHYLVECGFSGVDIDLLVVGLPMSQYYTDSGKRSDIVKRKIQNLMRPVTAVGETPPPANIRQVFVVPQGHSVIADHVMGWDIILRNKYPERTAIIDIGGRTTDLAYIINGKKNEASNSGSLQIGVLDVLGQLNSNLMTHFDRLKKYPPQILDRALRDRHIVVNGRREDVGSLVDQAVNKVASRIITEIRARMTDADIADEVIIVGGGATVFASVLRKAYPGAIIPPDPSWANVRGFWKLGSAMPVTA
jgi:plasmid segregation protein ParM